MAVTLYTPDGKPVTLDDDEAAQAVAAGRFGFEKGKPVSLVSPHSGKVGQVSVDAVNEYLARGYRLENDEEHVSRSQAAHFRDRVSPAGQAVTAAALGAGRSLTGGATDLLVPEGYGESYSRFLQSEQPVATGVGEVLGVAGGIAMGQGVPGLIAKGGKALAAKAAAKTVLGRAAVAGTAGTAEGTLYGLGHFVSEQALAEKPDLAAEKLLAAMGGGAAAGGILVGGGSLAWSALKGSGSALMSKFGGRAMKDWLDGAANEHTRRAVGFIQSDLTGMSEQQVANLGPALRRMGAVPSATADAAAIRPRLQGLKQQVGGDIGAILQHADDVTGGTTARATVAARKAEFQALKDAEKNATAQMRSALESRAVDEAALREGWRAKSYADLQRELWRVERALAGDGTKEQIRAAYRTVPNNYSHASLLPDTEEVGVLFAIADRKHGERVAALHEIVERMEKKRFGTFAQDTLNNLGGMDPKARKQFVDTFMSRFGQDTIEPPNFADGVGFDGTAFVSAARRRLLGELSQPEYGPARAGILRMLKEYEAKAAAGMSFVEANAAKTRLQKSIAKFTDAPLSADLKIKLQAILDDEIEGQLGKNLGSDFLDAFRASKKDYGVIKPALKANLRAIKRQEGNRGVSLTDYMSGIGGIGLGMATGNPLLAFAGVVASGVNKFARERGNSLLAKAAEKLAQGGSFPRMTKAFHKFISAGLSASPVFGGAARAELEKAAASGAMETVATYVSLAQADPSLPYALGLTPEDDEIANKAAVKADKMEALAQVLDAQDAKLDQSVDRFFGKQGGRAPVFRGALSVKDFKDQFARLEKMIGDTRALTEQTIPPDVSELSPALAAMMGATNVRAVQFLYNVAPKPPRRDTMRALQDEWTPSRVDLARWSRYVEAIERPDKVIEDMRSGRVMQEHVDALRVVYPRLIAELSQKMLERLAAYDKTLAYPQRLALSRFLGSPIGGAGDPKRLALLQQAHAASVAQQTPGQPDGRQKVSQDRNLETQGQRIEGRGGAS